MTLTRVNKHLFWINISHIGMIVVFGFKQDFKKDLW